MTAVSARRVDDNIAQDDKGVLSCVHCGEALGARGDEVYLEKALRVSRAPGAAGPQVRTQQGQFVDRTVSFRQLCCPGCGVALLSEIVPDDETSYRTKSL